MKKNNFDILRLSLSIIVLLAHAHFLSGSRLEILDVFSGYFAVKCFFVISGFLIFKSALNGSYYHYFKARFLRVLPLYFLTVTFTALVILFYMNFKGELVVAEVLKYYFANIIFLNFLYPTVPSLDFGSASQVVNGSLWTIKVELMFYVFVPLFLLFFKGVRQRLYASIFAYFCSVLIFYILDYYIHLGLIHPSLNNQLPSLLAYFMVGAIFNFLSINRISSSVFFVVPCLYLLFFEEIRAIDPILIGFFTLYVAFFLPKITIPRFVGDLSYGIYIFHFPIIQALVLLGLFSDFYTGLFLTFLIVMSLSWFSWKYIESKCLRLK